MCREVDINIRNLFAEKAITFMVIPCEYEPFGCRKEIQYREKAEVSWQFFYKCSFCDFNSFSMKRLANINPTIAPTLNVIINWPLTQSSNTSRPHTGKSVANQKDLKFLHQWFWSVNSLVRSSFRPMTTSYLEQSLIYFSGGDGAWSPRLITCFDQTFFDVALTKEKCLHHWVWFLGEKAEAKQFLYEITVFKGETK